MESWPVRAIEGSRGGRPSIKPRGAASCKNVLMSSFETMRVLRRCLSFSGCVEILPSVLLCCEFIGPLIVMKCFCMLVEFGRFEK